MEYDGIFDDLFVIDIFSDLVKKFDFFSSNIASIIFSNASYTFSFFLQDVSINKYPFDKAKSFPSLKDTSLLSSKSFLFPINIVFMLGLHNSFIFYKNNIGMIQKIFF